MWNWDDFCFIIVWGLNFESWVSLWKYFFLLSWASSCRAFRSPKMLILFMHPIASCRWCKSFILHNYRSVKSFWWWGGRCLLALSWYIIIFQCDASLSGTANRTEVAKHFLWREFFHFLSSSGCCHRSYLPYRCIPEVLHFHICGSYWFSPRLKTITLSYKIDALSDKQDHHTVNT